MKYLPRNRRNNPYSKKILFLAGVFAAGAALFYIAGPLVVPMISPVWQAENIVTKTVSGNFNLLRSKRSLAEENALLKERIASMEAEFSSRSVGEFLSFARTGGITASVVVRPPQSPYDIILVDKGSNDGVINGAKVSMPEGPELGRVVEVFPNQSRVRLWTSSGQKLEAILERFEVPVLLEGMGGGNFLMRIPRETEVMVGDRILSAGTDGGLLAVVGDVELKPTDSFKEVLAKSPISIWTLRFVNITNE